MGEEKATAPKTKRDISHEAKTHLLVLRMGLELLEKAKNDPKQIDQLIEMMRHDGLEPLRDLVAELVERIEKQNPSE